MQILAKISFQCQFLTHMQKAVLVGVQLPKTTNDENEASLVELGRLVSTLGFSVIGQMTQRRSSQKSATVLGEGRLKTLAQWTGGTGVIASTVVHKKSKAALKFEKNLDASEGDDLTEDVESQTDEESDENVIAAPKEKAEIVVFDCDLSPSQLRNLESATGVQVLDRTGVIIEIFSRHARTKSARLQVEIARLTYVAPRLRETGGGGDRGGGGVGAKGSGETTLELEKRHIRDRIKELKIELGAIDNEHLVRRARRSQERSVALVGYTNAGKSSLMRAMTGSEVLIADKLFATLDTTVRPLYPETKPNILLSDTVGFIKKLPHDLVASFKSTLDEALNASLLLFVVDAADPTFRSQLEVTQAVLKEVGAVDVPSLLILNKRDRLSPEETAKLQLEFSEAVLLSTRYTQDLTSLREKLMSYFEGDMIDENLFIPYTTPSAIGEIRARMRVISENYDEKGTTLKVRALKESLDYIKRKFELS